MTARSTAGTAAAALTAAALLTSCATVRSAPARVAARVEVLTPVDAVPVRSEQAWLPGGDVAERRAGTLRALRGDLADALVAAGVRACEGAADGLAGRDELPRAAALARRDGADAAIVTEVVAYGEVRRSWLWLLAGQGFLAGVGHGVAAAKLTGRVATGWWVGLGEFALETVTWVGGALFASRTVDPVVMRCWAVRADGAVVGHWTVEGTSRVGDWLRRSGRPPRAARLRAVADGLFPGVTRKIARALAASESGAGRTARPLAAAPAGPR